MSQLLQSLGPTLRDSPPNATTDGFYRGLQAFLDLVSWLISSPKVPLTENAEDNARLGVHAMPVPRHKRRNPARGIALDVLACPPLAFNIPVRVVPVCTCACAMPRIPSLVGSSAQKCHKIMLLRTFRHIGQWRTFTLPVAYPKARGPLAWEANSLDDLHDQP
eukprot:1136501-Pelagomonas_calceolata.AAC.2